MPVHKTQRQRLHGDVGGDGGLDQVGMKWFERQAVTRGAFRKYRQHLAFLQMRHHVMHHAVRIAPRLTLNEQGACT